MNKFTAELSLVSNWETRQTLGNKACPKDILTRQSLHGRVHGSKLGEALKHTRHAWEYVNFRDKNTLWKTKVSYSVREFWRERKEHWPFANLLPNGWILQINHTYTYMAKLDSCLHAWKRICLYTKKHSGTIILCNSTKHSTYAAYLSKQHSTHIQRRAYEMKCVWTLSCSIYAQIRFFKGTWQSVHVISFKFALCKLFFHMCVGAFVPACALCHVHTKFLCMHTCISSMCRFTCACASTHLSGFMNGYICMYIMRWNALIYGYTHKA